MKPNTKKHIDYMSVDGYHKNKSQLIMTFYLIAIFIAIMLTAVGIVSLIRHFQVIWTHFI